MDKGKLLVGINAWRPECVNLGGEQTQASGKRQTKRNENLNSGKEKVSDSATDRTGVLKDAQSLVEKLLCQPKARYLCHIRGTSRVASFLDFLP